VSDIALVVNRLVTFWMLCFIFGPALYAEDADLVLTRLRAVEIAALAEKIRMQTAGLPAPTSLPPKISEALHLLSLEHPERVEIPVTAATIAIEFDLPHTAELWLHRALLIDPKHAAAYWLFGGLAVKRLDIVEAAACYATAVELDDSVAAYHFDLATVLTLFRHDMDATRFGANSAAVLQRGLDHYRRASELEPTNREYLRAFAETHYILEKPDWATARNAWFAVWKISPRPNFDALHLVRTSIKEGRFDEATWWLDTQSDGVSAVVLEKLREQLDKARILAEKEKR